MDEKVIKNICELPDKRNKKRILLESIQELRLSQSSRWHLVVSVFAAMGISLFAIFFSEPVVVARNIFAMLLDVELALFAVIFGAYAIFQALMRDEIIKELIKTENNILKESNQTFLNLSILYILSIFVTVICGIIANVCSEEFFIWTVSFSNMVYVVVISVFLTLNFLLILENINFVINMYRMFNVYNVYRALDVMDDTD